MSHDPGKRDFEQVNVQASVPANVQADVQVILAAYPRLLRYARQLTGNGAAANDLVQDTIERGLKGCGRFQGEAAVNRWLCTILRRLFIDGYRHARVAHRLGRQWHDEKTHGGIDPGRDEDEGSSSALHELFTIDDVRRATALLTPCLRKAYAMYTFDRISYAEIARRLAVPPATVASRISRARDGLRDLLLSGSFRSAPASRPGQAVPHPLAAAASPTPPLAVAAPPRTSWAPRRAA